MNGQKRKQKNEIDTGMKEKGKKRGIKGGRDGKREKEREKIQ